ncbi:hypothetical protein MBRA_01516 [Methylobacterium brachiatum]|nr:hypothetical protein MBRA_01516 [Methylobacterium brachiatum]
MQGDELRVPGVLAVVKVCPQPGSRAVAPGRPEA